MVENFQARQKEKARERERERRREIDKEKGSGKRERAIEPPLGKANALRTGVNLSVVEDEWPSAQRMKQERHLL